MVLTEEYYVLGSARYSRGTVVAMCDELWRMDTQLAQKAQLDAYTMGTQLDLRRGTPKVGWHDCTLWSINGVTLFRSL